MQLITIVCRNNKLQNIPEKKVIVEKEENEQRCRGFVGCTIFLLNISKISRFIK